MRTACLWLFIVLTTLAAAARDEPPAASSAAAQSVAGPAATAMFESATFEDPFPLHRFRAREDQVPQILKQPEAGTLVHLDRADFEARVQAAGRALADARTLPRVTHTRYRAALAGGDLTGTAELDLINPGPGPRFLPLEALRLGVSAATWADGREAILGVPSTGTTAGVWVDRAGERTMKFAWSAAGTVEFGERRFDLRIPPAVSTTLDLELPADQRPTVAADLLLTGPFPVRGRGPRAGWRIRTGGRAKIEFGIRGADGFGLAATAALAAHYDLSPGQIAATFEYDLKPAKGTIGEWMFDVDPGFRVTGVVMNNLAGWSLDPPPSPTGRRRLHVLLNQPGTGGKVLISGLEAVSIPARQHDGSLPMIRPVGAVMDEERLDVRVAPELKIDRWLPGDYRLRDALVLPDHGQLLVLHGTLLAPGADLSFRNPPTVSVRPGEAEYAATEQLAWQFEGDRSVAHLRLGIVAKRQPMFRVSVRTPPGYTFVRATAPGTEAVAAATATDRVTVEFDRPLMPGQSAEVLLEFRGPRVAATPLPIPAFTPLGARERTGVVGLLAGPHWKLSAELGAGMTPARWFDLSLPAVPAESVAAYRYAGHDPSGTVTLSPVRPDPATNPQAPGGPRDISSDPRSRLPVDAVPGPAGPSWSFSDVHLVTVIRSEADVEVIFTGRVESAAAARLPIRLPEEAAVRSAWVDDRAIDRGILSGSAGDLIQLPLPSAGPVRFEIRYMLPAIPSSSTGLASPAPELPNSTATVRRWWAFGGDFLPWWPASLGESGQQEELPGLLGPSPAHESNVLIVRSDAASVWVAPADSCLYVGLVLAAGMFVLAWVAIRARSRTAGGLAVAGLLLAVVAWLGPAWWHRAAVLPLAIGLPSVATLALLRGCCRAAAPALAVAALLGVGGIQAQSPPPAAVVILPRDAEGRELVVAPKAVLDRLSALTHPVPPGVIVTAAAYTIAVEDVAAQVTARYTVHALSDTDPAAILPLAEGRLERVTVDTKTAYPIATRPGVYSVPLPGRGRHEIEVRMAVAVGKTGTEREFHFGVPECPAATVSADFPLATRQLQCLSRFGKQTIAEGSTRHVDIDTGGTKAIQFRWREGAAGTASIRVREAGIWDVSEKGAELTAAYITRVDQGTVSTLRYDLPPDLELVDVQLRPVDAAGSAALRDWSIVEPGGVRQLRLDLQAPTGDRILTVLTCRLKKAVTRQPVLRYPKPVVPGITASSDAVYAIRARDGADRVLIEGLSRVGLATENPNALTRDREWMRVLDRRLDAGAVLRVFRPAAGGGPELRATLRAAVTHPVLTTETTWQVEPHRAISRGTIRWMGKAPLPVLEFDLPGVQVMEVRGPDVSDWRQAGGRVTAWLNKPVAEGRVEWVGGTVPVPPAAPPPASFALDAVTPRLIESKAASESVTVTAVGGWVARVDRDRGWTAIPGEGVSYQATAPPMPVRVVFTQSAAKGPAVVGK